MLIRLEIENFYSVRDPQVLDLRVAASAPRDDRFAMIFPKENLRVPKVVSLFGANASGKTTILRAVSFLRAFASESFDDYDPGDYIGLLPFDSSQYHHRPTKLAIEFCFLIDPAHSYTQVHRYELHVGYEDGKNYVEWESLLYRTDRGKFQPIFTRSRASGQTKIWSSDDLPLEQNDPRKGVRQNVGLLSSLRQFGHEEAEHLSDLLKYGIVTNISLGRLRHSEDYVSDYLSKHDESLVNLNKLVRLIDVGIERVELMEIDGKKKAFFRHTGLDGLKTMAFESQGTQNFYCLFPTLSYALNIGAMAVLDEIDSDLHPSLLSEIVTWFLRKKDEPSDSQLIMSCQHASLLNMLTKEEVFLVEKGEDAASNVSHLASLTSLRRDANLYKKYMAGEFGAVPQFG